MKIVAKELQYNRHGIAYEDGYRIVYFYDVSMTAYKAHLGGWNIFLDILVGYEIKIEIWGD